MDYVVDCNGHSLRPGNEVRIGKKTGTYLRFEDDRYPWVGQGALSGQIVVDVDEREERFPTFSNGTQDVCYDVEKT